MGDKLSQLATSGTKLYLGLSNVKNGAFIIIEFRAQYVIRLTSRQDLIQAIGSLHQKPNPPQIFNEPSEFTQAALYIHCNSSQVVKGGLVSNPHYLLQLFDKCVLDFTVARPSCTSSDWIKISSFGAMNLLDGTSHELNHI
jgi:hypothetical protein